MYLAAYFYYGRSTHLQKRFERPSQVGIAVYDGEGYRQYLEFLSSISLILNTDGVALFRSSSTSIWPVWAVVNHRYYTRNRIGNLSRERIVSIRARAANPCYS